ncbi:MAG: diguanylate cyclase [Gallionella sp.]|nr:diguanylate cyclase [Gallionella sp.]MDP1941637.1 diguanylate cyclase [Gallionella sp.]
MMGTLKDMTQMAEKGVDTIAEFRDVDILCGQSYLIAHPAAITPPCASAEADCLFNAHYIVEQPSGNSRSVTVETLLRYVESFQPDTGIEKIFAHFSADKSLRSIPVVERGRPVGLINRHQFFDSFAQPFHRELPGKKTCAELMNQAPLLVDKSTTIHELSEFLSESDIRHFTDGFIITEQGRYIGLGIGQDLLREITKAHIETKSYAHPLTLLPGNIPINELIEDLLQSGKSFAVCYGDLDNFKHFNDKYGYDKGDELIQFTGKLLGKVCDSKCDFIGHIGGDDFILVLQSPDWELRCDQALTAFAKTSATMFDKEDRSIGGYLTEDRQGRIVYRPLPTLTIGAVWISSDRFDSHHEVSDAVIIAKNLAKKIPGNSLFVERRELPQSEMGIAHYG